jgi:hypothetical protein
MKLKGRDIKKQLPKRNAKKAVKIFLSDFPIGFDDCPPTEYNIKKHIAKVFGIV